jgi:hypothetical protein
VSGNTAKAVNAVPALFAFLSNSSNQKDVMTKKRGYPSISNEQEMMS